MVQKELYNVKGSPQDGGRQEEEKKRLTSPLRALFSQARQKLTSSEGKFVSSDHESIQLCVLGSYSIIPNIHINRRQTH